MPQQLKGRPLMGDTVTTHTQRRHGSGRMRRLQASAAVVLTQTAQAGRGFVDPESDAINTNAPGAEGCDRDSNRGDAGVSQHSTQTTTKVIAACVVWAGIGRARRQPFARQKNPESADSGPIENENSRQLPSTNGRENREKRPAFAHRRRSVGADDELFDLCEVPTAPQLEGGGDLHATHWQRAQSVQLPRPTLERQNAANQSPILSPQRTRPAVERGNSSNSDIYETAQQHTAT